MEQEFITLLKHPNYEISTSEPWTIKRKSDGKVLKQWLDSKGYYRVWLDSKSHLLHRVVAAQYLENPEKMSDIDHCDRCRTNNSISNLRWTSRNINICNQTGRRNVKYEYLNELPEGFEPFIQYKMSSGEKRLFTNLFIKVENDVPYFISFASEHQHRRLYENIGKTGNRYVNHNDITGKKCHICFSRINKNQNTISDTQKIISETENTLAKAILNLTEILKNQQEQQAPDEEQNEED
jgi:hypothetical protein